MKRLWHWLYFTKEGGEFMALLSILISAVAIAMSLTTMILRGER
jgi:hypothetical protein